MGKPALFIPTKPSHFRSAADGNELQYLSHYEQRAYSQMVSLTTNMPFGLPKCGFKHSLATP